jgi:hypothetical protein
LVLGRILRREPHSIVVSAKTGQGIEELLGLIEDDLPRGTVAIDVVIGYDRGDLVARAHREGELDVVDHLESGTRLVGRVNPDLAESLSRVAVSRTEPSVADPAGSPIQPPASIGSAGGVRLGGSGEPSGPTEPSVSAS